MDKRECVAGRGLGITGVEIVINPDRLTLSR